MNRIEKLMYRSLDARLTEEESKTLERALQESPQLQSRLDEITALREAAKSDGHEFSPWFDAKVMHTIKELQQNGIKAFPFQAYRTATIVGFAAIAAMLVIALIFNGSLSINSITGLDSINSENLTAFLAFDF